MRLGGALLGAALLLVPQALAAASPGPDLDAIRELLRRGERAKALDASRTALQADPDAVEVHLLYQDAARGQVPATQLSEEYKARQAAKPSAESLFLWTRTLPPADAEKELREAAKKDSKSYWLQVGLASALIRLGKGSATEQAALAALELRPGDAASAVRAADQCAAARRFAAAEACYRKAIEAGAAGPGPRLGLAHALLRLGRVDDAAALLQEVRSAGKADPRLFLLEAAVAAERGDSAGAEKALAQVTTVDPNDQDAVVQLALLRLKAADAKAAGTGKPVEAKTVAGEVAALEKAVAALPDRADVRYALGFAREVTGNADAALAEYREATRVDPLDGAAFAAAGAILVAKGALEEAASEFQKAVDRDTDDPGALLQLAVVLDLQSKTKEATAAYQKVVKMQPGNARAWHALGLALEGGGRSQEALPAFAKAAELDSKSGRYLRDLGEAYHQRKGYDKAEQTLSKAVEIAPKDDLAWMALGRTRTQMKKYEKAAEAYEKAAELRPKDKDIQLLLGAYVHEFLKNYEKAILHYNKYVQLGGDSGDVDEWMGECEAEIEKRNGGKKK